MEEADGEEALLEGLGLGRLGVEVAVGVVEVAHAQRGLDAARRLDGHLDRVLVRLRVRVRARARVRVGVRFRVRVGVRARFRNWFRVGVGVRVGLG